MDLTFELIKSGCYISKNIFTKEQTPLRQVENYEVELYSTDGSISVINGKKYYQKKGNALISRPGDKRYSIGDFECRYVHFICHDEEIKHILNTLPRVFVPEDITAVKEILEKLKHFAEFDKIQKKLYAQGLMLELTSKLYDKKTHEKNEKYPLYTSYIDTACCFMEENSEKHITLAEIAAKVNLSPGFFHNVFKAQKNITPAEYLLNLRLEKAKFILENSNTPLCETAIQCGFSGQAYFNYVFKKNIGETPKSYRSKKQLII